MAITSAQAAAATLRSVADPVTVAFGSNSTTGNLIEVVIAIEATNRTVSSVTDTLLNTYTASMTLQTVGSARFYRYYTISAATGANTVSVDLSAASTTSVIISEWNSSTGWPANPVDAVSVTVSGASTHPQATSLNTAQAEELILGAQGFSNTNLTISGVDISGTLHYPSPDASGRSKLAYLVTSSAGAYQMGFTYGTSHTWWMDAVAYKNVASATNDRRVIMVS